jgi:MFS transporter, AAHS family, 4-hydroxybenzoate transporter
MVGKVVAVSDLIDEGSWSVAQKLAALLAACAVTLDGLDIQVLSLAVPQIAKDWQLQKSSFALIFATTLVSMAVGSIAGGYFGDKLGRRKAIIIALVWFGVFTMLIASSKTLGVLFLFRLLSGLGIGAAVPNAAAYIAEVTPARARTAAVSSTIVCIPLGGVIGGLIAAQVLPVASWRLLIFIGGALPVLLAGVLGFTLSESPRFLAAGDGPKDAVLYQLKRYGLQADPDWQIVPEIRGAEEQGDDRPARLLGPLYRRDTLSLWAAFCFCMISVYLIFNWLPSLLSNLGLDSAATSKGLAAYNLYGIAGAILLGLWMNRVGSRIPFLISGIASVGSALWLALHLIPSPSGNTLLTLQIGAHGFFVNGVQSTLYAVAAQLYPTRLRARGLAAAVSIGRAGAVLSAFLGGRALHYPAPVYFFILAGTLTCTVVSLQFFKNHLIGTRLAAETD